MPCKLLKNKFIDKKYVELDLVPNILSIDAP